MTRTLKIRVPTRLLDRDSTSGDMHRGIDWLKPSDRPILLEFATYGPDKWMTSLTAALNLPYSQNHVSRRLRTLRDRGFVEPHDDARAAYRLTDRGLAYVDDQLSQEDLEGESG